MKIFSIVKTTFLDLLFPIFCFGCKKEGVFLCSDCKNKLVWIQPVCFRCNKWVPPLTKVVAGRTCLSCRKKSSIYAFFSPFLYSDPLVRNLIHGLKYSHLRLLANLLGGFLVEYIAKFRISFPEDILLVPVPLHPSRLRSRGFNQSELFVLYLSDRLKIKSEMKALQKIRKTKPQVELSAGDRRFNLVGAFAVSDLNLVKNKTILLVDDVKTTGFTLEEAARTLKSAGARRILALTVAR